jgi:putative redox protein
MTTAHATLQAISYKTTIQTGAHTIIADEPIADGGEDQGPAPYQLLLSALAACKVMTVRFYAKREQWPLEQVEAELTMETTREGIKTTAHIKAQLSFQGDLSPEQRAKLLLIADKCPVHKLLQGDFVIESVEK